jgi:hypothetical protein
MAPVIYLLENTKSFAILNADNAIALGRLPVSGGKSKSWTTLFYPKFT